MMRPENIQYLPVRETKGLITALDRYDLQDDFVFNVRGFLNTEKGYIGKRDKGTKQRYALIPYKPNTAKAISAVANNGSGKIRLTVNGHGRATGDIVVVHDMAGSGASLVNGIWTLTVVDPNTVDLQNSTYDGGLVYTVTNAKLRVPISLRRGIRFYDKETDVEHEVVVGVDENNKTRIYVWDGTQWQEMTRKINAKINGIPPAPGDTTSPTILTIDTITEEDGSTYVPQNDELIGWVVYNSTKGKASFVVDNTAMTISVVHNVTLATYQYADNDDLVLFRSKVVFTEFNSLNGPNPHVRFLAIDAQKKCTIFYADNSGVNLVRKSPVQVKKQIQREFFGSITGGTKASGTIDGRNATHTDFVYINGFAIVRIIAPPTLNGFHNGVGFYSDLAAAINNSPDISALVVGAPIAGDNNNVTVTAKVVGTDGNSITLARSGSDPQFVISGPTLTGGTNGAPGPGQISLPAGFYMEKAYFTRKFKDVGSVTGPRSGTNPAESIFVGDGIRVDITYSELTSALGYRHLRAYLIPIYRGSQYADPILKLYLSGSEATKFASATLKILVDPSALPMDITAFQLYIAAEKTGVPTQADWIDDPTEYLQKSTAQISSGFVYNNADSYCFAVEMTTGLDGEFAQLDSGGAIDILTQMGHAPTAKERTELQPLYAIMGGRSQASLIIVDQDDDVLRTSNYNGDGTHEEDSFPEVALNAANQKLKLLLMIQGELLGLSVINGLVAALKQNDIQLRDLDSGRDSFLPADVYSRDSILLHDYGLSWSGTRDAYLIPHGSMEIIPLLADIKNLFDGSLLIDDRSASYVTDAYRSAVISGWDPVYDAIWFHLQANKDAAKGGGSEYLNFRVSMDRATLATNISVRKLNIGSNFQPVRYFDKSNDGTMVIGYATGILQYPVLTGARRYEDDVRSDGVTAGRGIPTSALIHLGSIASLSALKTLYSMVVGFIGESVNGMGLVTVKFYVDDLVLFDTKKFRVDGKPETLYINPVGAMKRLWIEVSLPESSLTNFLDLDISELNFGFLPQ